jgi:radical SAM superfamily enzyme YgiQ (UPF0313 family)
MKILLIHPKFETHIIVPSLGLGYLAASLKEAGHEVMLLDCLLKDIGLEKFRNILSNEKPVFVGVNAMTTYYSSALEYVMEAKKQGIITCMGGPHITSLPERSLLESKADFVVVGEGDKTIVSLVNAIENGESFKNIKGIGFKDNDKIIINPRAELIDDLDSLPFPAWDLMKPKTYPIAPHGAFVKRFPVAAITTTRGCQLNCSFCASRTTWLQRLRFRDPIKIVDEIEMLNKKYGVKEFHFEDDNFTSKRSHALEVCKEIIRRKLDIVWACPNGVRIDKLDEELLSYMKKSGCYLLAFGIESGNQRILDKVNKHLKLEIVPKILKLVKKAGIETWGFFILGLPGETYSSAKDTINFAVKNKFDRAQFCIFTPLPGSSFFYEWAKDKKDFNWNDFNYFSIVYEGEELSKDQLQELHKLAFKKFYLRPRILVGMLKHLKIAQIKWLFKRVVQYHITN